MARSDTASDIDDWGECWVEPVSVPPDLAADVRRATGGMVPGWVSRLAPVPWLPRAFARLTETSIAHMPLALVEPIAFVVSRDNSCRYCYGNMRAILRILGYRERTIDRLEHDGHLAELSPAEQGALAFARNVSHANPRPDAEELAELRRAGFTQPAIAEIAYTAVSTVFSNRVATLIALPPERFLAVLSHPLARIVRPFVARQMRGRLRPPAPLPVPNDGPCAAVVAALGGSPAARVLRDVVDEAIASPVLPRRTKLLMLGVVGRALGCDHAEEEASVGLATEGFTRDDVAAILANLGSPKLDARDALLVPFARETVRYQNMAIQQRTRALRDRLSNAEVLEAVGIAALANSVGRLSVLLQTC